MSDFDTSHPNDDPEGVGSLNLPLEGDDPDGVGSLNLPLEGSDSDGVGSLDLPLEGSAPDGVGSLNLPLEGSDSNGVGSLGLPLEGSDSEGVGSLGLPLEGSASDGVGSLDLPLEGSDDLSDAVDKIVPDAPTTGLGPVQNFVGGDGDGSLASGLGINAKTEFNPLGKDNPLGKLAPTLKTNVKLDATSGLKANVSAGNKLAGVGLSTDGRLQVRTGARRSAPPKVRTTSQTKPRFYFEAANLPPEVFLVTAFKGTEELSHLFRFEIDLVSTDAYIDFDDVINEPATFTMLRDDVPVPVEGIVVDFEQLGKNNQYVAYRVVLAPRLWRLSLNFQSRVFQNLTVEEIITQVLTADAYGFMKNADFAFDLKGQYDPREYCVQFQETDLDFVSRLMEYEGMYYYFEHTEGREKLLITDHTLDKKRIDGLSELDYRLEDGLLHEEPELVHEFVCREQVVPGKVLLKDYNYETPDEGLLAEWPKKPEQPGVWYAYGERYKTLSEGERLAQVRHEEIIGQRRIITGASNSRGFRSGYLFALQNHYRTDYNEEYMITSVRHEGSQWQTMELDIMVPATAEDEIVYQNTFRCQPANQPFRPQRRTPVPHVPGVMVAKIEHPQEDADDYGHLDDQGRYRARVNFDLRTTEEAEPAQATLPMRMNQPYSGPGYGVHFPHHHGTEMLWACVNGDIDRPVALGTVPNPNEASPSTAPNRWQSVIRTWGQNELTFDDKKGEENIYMHATKDHTAVVTNDETITVGRNQTLNVGNDRTKIVGHDEYNTIRGNRVTTILEGGEQLTVEKGRRTVVVHGPEGDVHYVTEAGREVYVSKDDYLYLEKGTQRVFINKGDANLLVQDGKRTVTVGKDSEHTAKGKLKSHSDDEMTVSSAKKITITAKDEIVLVVGSSSITLSKDKGIVISGPKIASNAVGMHEITGALVKVN